MITKEDFDELENAPEEWRKLSDSPMDSTLVPSEALRGLMWTAWGGLGILAFVPGFVMDLSDEISSVHFLLRMK